MKRFMIAGVAALSTLAATTAVYADPPAHARAHGRSDVHDCRGNRGDCRGRSNPGHGWNDERHGGRHLNRHDHDDDTVVIWGNGGQQTSVVTTNVTTTNVTINIGDDGRRGERWTWRDGYGIPPAPRNTEYRVINGQLVTVDLQTLQVIAVLGLLSTLIN